LLSLQWLTENDSPQSVVLSASADELENSLHGEIHDHRPNNDSRQNLP